ncbi:RagB/SusD family nutrient uptake outer membrane protein [Seonamhaeicola sp.]|uniref:RagB/SusD family nutrient uptake outer membrane protein n=1 Tax=Seonamhaeicola sp. TaxID=1912245 RepID=UPI002628F929|nr:RagB/SusD family nutrient uptake outer membrane protein [Seonamhaeicola sp.]
MKLHINKTSVWMYTICAMLILTTVSCDSFVEVDSPKNSLVTKTVFEDAATVEAAMANIFVKMRQQGLVSGNFSISASLGIYADELDYFGNSPDILKLYSHNVLASDGQVSLWWNHAFNLIYAANDIIEGVAASQTLSEEDKNRFTGQALFIRTYLNSLLLTLFGEVPYIITTDYVANNRAFRTPEAEVYEKLIGDLNEAANLLENSNQGNENILPNLQVVHALLARIYLYSGDWAMAETMASNLIGDYALEDIDKVFLKGSRETIWQLMLGDNPVNTYDALQLIITGIPTQGMALTDDLLAAFEAGDMRYVHWIANITSGDGQTTLYYAHKYKATHNTTNQSEEYPILFRLAEQYLIRAEARVQLGDISGAQADINAIRNRAGLSNTAANDKASILDTILDERRLELFTEQGHRWFDLKRMGKADAVLSPIKAGWRSTDIILPIPESELELNPNLKPQNDGY